MIENWDKIIASAGWVPYEGTPFYHRFFGDKLFFSAIPDASTGVIPIELDANVSHQKSLFDSVREFSSNIYIGDLNDVWKIEGFKVMPIDYQVIDTGGLKLEKDTRNQVQQAEKYGVHVEATGRLSEYLPIVEETADRQDRDPLSKWKLQHLWRYSRFLRASYEGQTIAGCIYAQSSQGLHLLHSSSKKDFQHVRPNHAIMAYLIKLAAGRRIWLGNAPKELEGLRKFKESFGAKLLTFPLKYFEI